MVKRLTFSLKTNPLSAKAVSLGQVLKQTIPALLRLYIRDTSKKSPNVYKSCPKMSSPEKLKILRSLQKLPKNLVTLNPD